MFAYLRFAWLLGGYCLPRYGTWKTIEIMVDSLALEYLCIILLEFIDSQIVKIQVFLNQPTLIIFILALRSISKAKIFYFSPFLFFT